MTSLAVSLFVAFTTEEITTDGGVSGYNTSRCQSTSCTGGSDVMTSSMTSLAVDVVATSLDQLIGVTTSMDQIMDITTSFDQLMGVTTSLDELLGGVSVTAADHILVVHNYWTLVLIIFPVMTVFGNILVALSIYRERSLQSVTNYFIFSLAIADIMVALLVMPLAIYVEVLFIL